MNKFSGVRSPKLVRAEISSTTSSHLARRPRYAINLSCADSGNGFRANKVEQSKQLTKQKKQP